MIAISGWFCFVHIDETLFKSYSCTVIHPSFPRNYVLIYLLFRHFLLVEGSHYFYIISLIVCIFYRRWLFWIGFFLKVEIISISIKSTTVCKYFSNPNMEITTTHETLLFRIIICAILLFFAQHMWLHFSSIRYFLFQKYVLNILDIFCLKQKNRLL